MDFGWNPALQLAGIVLNHLAGTTSQSVIIELSYTVLEFVIEFDDEQQLIHNIGNTLEVFEDFELAPHAPVGGPY